MLHDDVIKWKPFPRYWPFVREINRSPVNSPHKGHWRVASLFSLICALTSDWVNNRDAGDLRRLRAHYDSTVICQWVRVRLRHICDYPRCSRWQCVFTMAHPPCMIPMSQGFVDGGPVQQRQTQIRRSWRLIHMKFPMVISLVFGNFWRYVKVVTREVISINTPLWPFHETTNLYGIINIIIDYWFYDNAEMIPWQMFIFNDIFMHHLNLS